MTAQFMVRNLEDAVKLRLQRRAARHGRSMEEEVGAILRGAVSQEDVPSGGVGKEIASLFSTAGLTSDIRELTGYAIRPMRFDQKATAVRKDRAPSGQEEKAAAPNYHPGHAGLKVPAINPWAV